VSVLHFRASCIKYFVIYFVLNIIEHHVTVLLSVDVLAGKDIFVYNKYTQLNGIVDYFFETSRKAVK